MINKLIEKEIEKVDARFKKAFGEKFRLHSKYSFWLLVIQEVSRIIAKEVAMRFKDYSNKDVGNGDIRILADQIINEVSK